MTAYKNLAIVVVTLLFLTFMYNWVDSRAYNRAVVEIANSSADLLAKATKEALKDAEAKIAEAQKRNRAIFDEELRIAKENTVVESEIKEIITHVDKIIYVDNCGKLNDSSIRLLNETVSKINTPSEN